MVRERAESDSREQLVQLVEASWVWPTLRYALKRDSAEHFRGERLLAGVLPVLRFSGRPTQIAAEPLAVDAPCEGHAGDGHKDDAREHPIPPLVATAFVVCRDRNARTLSIAQYECGNTRTMHVQPMGGTVRMRAECAATGYLAAVHP